MSQIHTQGSHFWRLLVTVDFDDGFNTKMCSVDHIIIVVYINDVAIEGLPKCPKFICRGHTGLVYHSYLWSQHRWWQSLRNGRSRVSVYESVSHDDQCK